MAATLPPLARTAIIRKRTNDMHHSCMIVAKNFEDKGNSMKTALLEGKKPAHFDKHIIGNILLDVAPADEVREEKMLIGVRNEAGEIYRLIGATKVNSFMNAVEELFDLGLSDELEDTEEPKDGCDAIFSES
jgi:hypothetical protein